MLFSPRLQGSWSSIRCCRVLVNVIFTTAAGFVVQHPLLKQFLQLSREHVTQQVPGSTTPAASLSLALVVIYTSPAFRQQAIQVTRLPFP